MDAHNFDLAFLKKAMHSPIHNYVIPGLSSYLVGEHSKHGTVRVFMCSREQQESITPHSHRFGLMSWVLDGSVRNSIWTPALSVKDGDLYRRSRLIYDGKIGSYQRGITDDGRWKLNHRVHTSGDCYSMEASDIHSIWFSRGAMVLVFEGPHTLDSNTILEPIVKGKTIETMKIEPWMFERELP